MLDESNSTVVAAAHPIHRAVTKLFILMIWAYQLAIRPFLIGSCKFQPSCSEYAAQALARHGLSRGAWLSVRRICKCHPFGPGGIDPVPEFPTPTTGRP